MERRGVRQAVFLPFAAALLASSCVRQPAPVGQGVHYVVGAGYRAGTVWYYPREDFHYDATGLASVLPAGRTVTADGEVTDGTALTAAHQTLQLPSVVRVTNLETGLQVSVRVNDRGPQSPGRLIALSRRTAELLGINGVARVRVQTDEAASTALRDQLHGGPMLAVAAAPRGAVRAEALPPPPGVSQSSRGRSAGVTRAATETGPTASAIVPERLPETVQRAGAAPGRLMIAAGSFGQVGYARQVAARLGGIGADVEQVRELRGASYRVKAGPLADVAAADAALERAMRAGVTDARIVIE